MTPSGLPLHPGDIHHFHYLPRPPGLLYELFHILSLRDGLLCIISLYYLP